MKVLVALSVISCCQAAILFAARNPDDVGAAVTFNKQDPLGTYDFGYSEGHPSGASFRRESGDIYGNKVGTFGLKDADGRVRIVRYVADANGFRADVSSNEPGVAPQDPASATINKPAIVPAPVVPVAPVAAPVVPVAPVAAPVALAPPPPPPAFFLPQPKPLPPPPPPQYNYVYSEVAPVAPPPPPPPPPAYYAPPPPPPPPAYAVSSPVAIPGPPPVAKAPVGFPAYGPAPPPPPPPPPPAYYSNMIPGKGYVSAVRNYGSFEPPFAGPPPRYGFLNSKPPVQPLAYPL